MKIQNISTKFYLFFIVVDFLHGRDVKLSIHFQWWFCGWSWLADEGIPLPENAVDSQESVRQKLILLDARNLYETRIGKFKISNVETLDPEIRQYSDLPAWIDEHSEQLRGKQVLM